MPALPGPTNVQAELARRSFYRFVTVFWGVVEPGEFVPGWHIELICHELEAVERGERLRLLINLPARHGKSLITAVFWPAWVWARDPTLRFMFLSYSQQLSTRDSRRCRALIESPLYQSYYGTRLRLLEDQNTKDRFENDHRGARLATSIGGAATGEGGEIIVIDDAHKIEEGESAAMRESTIAFFDGVISTRRNNPKTSRFVVIGHRIHEHDLSGHLIERDSYHHVCLPAEHDPEHLYRHPKDPRSTPGEPLWPAHFDTAVLAEEKRTLGAYRVAAQLQQQPGPAGGLIFERAWWNYYDPEDPPTSFELIVQSWDLAFSNAASADYTVGQVWGIDGPRRRLLRQTRRQMNFPQTLDAILELTDWADEHHPRQRGHRIYIENAANGAAIISTLKQHLSSVIAVTPRDSKQNRARAASAQVQAGNVYLPGFPNAAGSGPDPARTPLYVQEFIEEHTRFPGRYDDQVDACSQALLQIMEYRAPQFRVLGPTAPLLTRPRYAC